MSESAVPVEPGPEQPLLRLMVVDDHPVFRIGMSALLDRLDGIEVVATAEGPDRAVELATRTRPDVVIMDLDLAGESGVEATRRLRRDCPGAAVLVVTMLGDDDALFGALRAGASGYLLKGATPDEIERAVRSVAGGAMVMGPQVAARFADYLSGLRTRGGVVLPELTDREREVLTLVARGLDNASIARRLVLSAKTVRNYVSGIAAKLGAADRPRLIVLAREAGLGTGPDGEQPR